MKSIYLCGFMGSGKSTIGQRLAKKLGVAFLDTDREIAEQTGKSIIEIFEGETEERFRHLERALMQKLSGTRNKVISVGGGTFLSAENARLAKTTGLIVFLEAPFSVCYDRITRDSSRPIVNRSSKDDLKELFDKREGSYRQAAHLTISADQSAEYCAQEIKTLLVPFL